MNGATILTIKTCLTPFAASGMLNDNDVSEAVSILQAHVERESKPVFEDRQLTREELKKRWRKESSVSIWRAEKRGLKKIPGLKPCRYWLSEIIKYENQKA